MSLLRRFLEANSRLSSRVGRHEDTALYARYDAGVLDAIRALPQRATVLDLGGGRHCSFASYVDPSRDVRIVAVDVSATELAANTSVDATCVADVAKSLPFADGSVDLVVSRTLLEHVDGLAAGVSNIARVLRPGAQTLHLVPCRYALFAVVARAVPFSLAKRVLHTIAPSAEGVVEFDVFYDHTDPAGLERLFREAGFQQVEVEWTWDQASYFQTLFPLYLVLFAYQRLVEALGIRVLASYAIVRARK